MSFLKNLQFGLQINDAFGAVILLETAFTISNVLSDISLQIDLASVRENETLVFDLENDEIQCGAIAIICLLKFLLFFSLVWIGFICLKKPFLLKLWVLLGPWLDVTLQSLWLTILLTYYGQVEIPAWEFVLLACIVIVFRTYIYVVCWYAWKELSQGSDFRGYGEGLIYLFHYYKNEFQRVASILLVVEILWNLRTALEGDLPMELGMNLVGLEGNVAYFFSTAFPLRIIRIFLALLALHFVSMDKKTCLKFCWLPFFLVSTGLSSIYWTLFVEGNESTFHIYTQIILSILGVAFRSILIYYIMRFIFRKQNAPVPLESGSDQNDNDN